MITLNRTIEGVGFTALLKGSVTACTVTVTISKRWIRKLARKRRMARKRRRGYP